jgi:hypothetical protein
MSVEDMLCLMMMTTMTMPLMMPFVQGILFGMHLVYLQETQVDVVRHIPALKVTQW